MVNHYFNNYTNDIITQEQLLIEDLIIEALKIYSHNCYYLPRETRGEIDKLWGEDAVKNFPNAYQLEFYVENVMSMEGEMDMMSKFGLEIRDEMTLLVSRRRFKKEIPNISRPREGDILYIPVLDGFFEIFSTEHENNRAMFYTLGRGKNANVYVFALKLRQIVFSEEPMQTGIETIDDSIKNAYRPTILTLNMGGTGEFDFVNTEKVFSNTASANVISWNSSNRELELILNKGKFSPGQIITGQLSNAVWTINSVNNASDLDTLFEDTADNKLLQNEANTILDWSEQNPFGGL